MKGDKVNFENRSSIQRDDPITDEIKQESDLADLRIKVHNDKEIEKDTEES